MANKKDKNDDTLLVGLGSLLLGAAMATPNKTETAKVQEYKRNELLFQHFKAHLPDFQAFLIRKEAEDKRVNSLGEIRINSGIRSYPKEGELLNDALELYIQGFFRFSSIACAMVLESILKKRFGKMSFVDLINKAESEGILKRNDRKYIDGLRLDRNNHVHSVDDDITEDDAKLVIMVATRVLNAIL